MSVRWCAGIDGLLRYKSTAQVGPFAEAFNGSTTASGGDVHPGRTVDLFEMPDLAVVVAGLNSTMTESVIERTGGDFMFYEEGVTEAVGRHMKAVDDERLAIARALGVGDPRRAGHRGAAGYMTEPNYSTGYSTAPGFAASRRRTSSTTAT